jgi:hypothetical protein
VRSVTWPAYPDEQKFGTAGTLPQVRQSEKSVFALISSNTDCRINFSWVEKLAAMMSGDIAKTTPVLPTTERTGSCWRVEEVRLSALGPGKERIATEVGAEMGQGFDLDGWF